MIVPGSWGNPDWDDPGGIRSRLLSLAPLGQIRPASLPGVSGPLPCRAPQQDVGARQACACRYERSPVSLWPSAVCVRRESPAITIDAVPERGGVE